MFRSLALNENPAKTGETVIVWPLGKCTRLGAMTFDRSEHGTIVIFCNCWMKPAQEGPTETR